MDWLFGSQNDSIGESLDSMDVSRSPQHNQSMDEFDSGFRSTTTIEKSFDVSPIRKNSKDGDHTYGSVYDFDGDLSFDKNKSSRKYFSAKKSLPFSPTIGSTPKSSKSKPLRRTQTKRKKSYKNKRSDISLWDKAIVKSPELKQWINSFNDEMEKIESMELSVTKKLKSSNH